MILWIALPIFWGSLWLLLRYFNQLVVTVVDFESPLLGQDAALGPLLVRMAEETNVSDLPYLLRQVRLNLACCFPDANDASAPRLCRHASIRLSERTDRCEGSHWVFSVLGRYGNITLGQPSAPELIASIALVVYPNCTSSWRTAVQNGLADYDPTGCLGIFYSGARYYQVTLLYLAPFMQMFASQVVQQASTQALSQYLGTMQGNTTALSLLAQVPQAVSSPFSFYQEDVRPINQWGVAAPFEAALIYYLIMT